MNEDGSHQEKVTCSAVVGLLPRHFAHEPSSQIGHYERPVRPRYGVVLPPHDPHLK